MTRFQRVLVGKRCELYLIFTLQLASLFPSQNNNHSHSEEASRLRNLIRHHTKLIIENKSPNDIGDSSLTSFVSSFGMTPFHKELQECAANAIYRALHLQRISQTYIEPQSFRRSIATEESQTKYTLIHFENQTLFRAVAKLIFATILTQFFYTFAILKF